MSAGNLKGEPRSFGAYRVESYSGLPARQAATHLSRRTAIHADQQAEKRDSSHQRDSTVVGHKLAQTPHRDESGTEVLRRPEPGHLCRRINGDSQAVGSRGTRGSQAPL